MLSDKETIRILYIDDSPEIELAKFLANYQSNAQVNIDEEDIIFSPAEGYESLINNTSVREANIIIIDSKLFENRDVIEGKFTGEEFKLILRKTFPFIEVLVITQNDVEEGFNIISKYDAMKCAGTAAEYYGKELPEKIEESIKSILEYRKIASRLNDNKALEKVLIEKINKSLEGLNEYDELTKSDIDAIIEAFKSIQEAIDGQ